MKPYAAAFYSSAAWKRCREAYRERVGGLCEECLRRGIYTPAEIIHHIVEITPENVNDPAVTLNFQNLHALCRRCHAKAHGANLKRYTVNELGKVRSIDEQTTI